ncbi:MAG: DUF4403 family protein [Saprospiraceae bacterium]|nr:DUF4403 family protein [Saprospiraceae bacterium]
MNIEQIPLSVIHLPVLISRSELNRSTRQLMGHIFKDDLLLDGGFLCHIMAEENTDVQAVGNEIHFNIPLQLEIKHRGQLQNMKATGTLELHLNTKVDVFNNQFLSKTELVEYHWIKSPSVKVLGMSVPVELIANQLIKKYKTKLVQNIDQQIMTSANLKEIGSKVIAYFKNPFYTSEDGILKVFVSPQEFAIGPLTMDDKYITLPAVFYLENLISESEISGRPYSLDFSTRPYADTSSVFAIQSRIPLAYLEQILREQLLTQEFGSSMAKIKIYNLFLDGIEDRFEAIFETTGDFRGKFRLHFTPVFSDDSKKIELDKFRLDILAGKGLSKSLFAVFKNKVEKVSKEALELQLNSFILEYISTSEQFINNQSISNGIALNGSIDHFMIRDFWIQDKRMYFTVRADLRLKAKVDYIDVPALIRR